VGTLEEADGLHLDANAAAVFVYIERRAWIVRIPECIPRLIALRGVEGPALFVVAFRGHQVKALTHQDVMSQEVARHGFFHGHPTGVDRHYIDYSGTVVDAHDERLNPLQRHQERQGSCSRDGAQPAGSCDPPSRPLTAL